MIILEERIYEVAHEITEYLKSTDRMQKMIVFYANEEEEILPPKELIQQYQETCASLNAGIDRILAQITDILGIDLTEDDV